jgi:hypothetical protein
MYLEFLTDSVAGFASRVHSVLDDLRETPIWSMTPAEQRAAVVGLARAEARIAALRLRVLAAADNADVAAETAATSTGAWLAQATRRTRPAAHADVLLARSLDDTHRATRDALADGLLAEDQARVVVRAVDALPHRVATPRPHRPRPRLHRRRLRPSARLVPRPPRRGRLGRRRRHQCRPRPPALRLPPRQGALPRLRRDPTPVRQGQLPPTDVRRPNRDRRAQQALA